MKKQAFVVVLLASATMVLLPYSYKYWPSGKVQDYAFIWLKGDQISNLFSIAESKGYKRIFWCQDNLDATIEKQSGELLKNWESDENFKEFADAVSKSDLYCFLGRKHGNNWTISGSHDMEFVDELEGTKKRIITRYYALSKANIDGKCNERVAENTTLKDCTFNMFDNWYMGEEIITMPFEQYNDET